jgi:transcriptional regulator with XRE-family HTH domain
MKNLGETFRQIRISKNWSIREAAKRMGISYSYLSILEKGIDPRTGKNSNPKPDTLRIISKTYEYPYEELLKEAGYLHNDTVANRNFDLTVFRSNINLIKGNMTINELSCDIYNKTGYKIEPKQINSYLNGDIEPFPGTINILSKYTRVSLDFWYVFNTEETLEKERKEYQNQITKSSSEKLSKEYMVFSSIRDDIKKWIADEATLPYILVAMEAQSKKVSSHALKAIIDTIAAEKNKQ